MSQNNQRQIKRSGKSPKIRFSFHITEANYDYLCQVARSEERTVASALNRLISLFRETPAEPEGSPQNN